jgi:quercetin dioxygenase-like cupin family protein
MSGLVHPRARGTVLGGLVSLGLVAMMGAALAQQPAPPAASGRGNFLNNFTGNVTIGDSSDMRHSRIRFDAGARTNWHLHSTAQLLLVEEGSGRLQEQGKDIVNLAAGQPVLTTPNLLHWHGAAPDQAALQFSVYSGTLEWKDAVTDDQYLGRTRR